MERKRLGEVLLETGAIDIAGLHRALDHARQRRVRLGVALRELGLVPEERLAAALAATLGLPLADLRADDLDWTALHLLRPEFCEAHSLLPYGFGEERGHRYLRVAMADPLDVPALDEIEFTTGLRVRPAVASPHAVGEALVRWLRRERRPVPGYGAVAPATDPAPGPGPEELEELEVLDPELPPFTHGERPRPPEETRAARRRDLDRDLDFLTGADEAPAGTAAGPDDRLRRLEARMDGLVRHLAERGLLGDEELARLLG
jgi:hypothetical protein